MSHPRQLFAEPIERAMSEQAERCTAGENKEATMAIDVSICQQSQSFAEPSASSYVEPEVVECDDDPDLCLVETTLVTFKEEKGGEGTANEGITKETENIGDTEVEDREFDLDDVLDAEHAIPISDSASTNNTANDSASANDSDSHVMTGHVISGHDIPRPLSPFPFFNPHDIASWQQVAGFFLAPQQPQINGVEVCMVETQLTHAEIRLFNNQVHRPWRVRYLSRLRKCWMPVERELECVREGGREGGA